MKFFLKRIKEITLSLKKCNKPVEITVPKAAVEKEKKLAPIVIKVLQKLGKPRNIYNTIRELVEAKVDSNNSNDRLSYLLSWDQFLDECGAGCDLEKVKEIVDEIYDAFKNPDNYPTENSVVIILI